MRSVLSTSATTATLMVLAVTPTSLVVLPLVVLDCAPAGTATSAIPSTTRTATTPAMDDLRMKGSPLFECVAGS